MDFDGVVDRITEGSIADRVARTVISEEDETNDRMELARDIGDEIRKIFPKSYVNSRYSTNLSKSIFVTFALGKGTSEWANGIIQNDDAHNTFHIWFKPDGVMEMDASGSFMITVMPPEGSHMAYEGISVPFRKTKVKAGDNKKVLAVVKRNFSRLKDALKKNKDNLGHPEYAEGKV